MDNRKRWVPAGLMMAGVLLVRTAGQQQRIKLETPLSSVPTMLGGYESRDVAISEGERQVAGMDNYLARIYEAGPKNFSLYIGYYESQTQGRTIHSPKNCLPGAGWEPVTAERRLIVTDSGSVPVNRYLIANKGAQAIVYYWYQGRGRVSANEYLVKWELIRDASIRRRTDEALVRVVVPVDGSVAAADSLGQHLAEGLIPTVAAILPR